MRDYELEARKSKSPPTFVANVMETTNPEKQQRQKNSHQDKGEYHNRPDFRDEYGEELAKRKKHENTIYVDNILSVKARSPGMVRVISSPKHSMQKY